MNRVMADREFTVKQKMHSHEKIPPTGLQKSQKSGGQKLQRGPKVAAGRWLGFDANDRLDGVLKRGFCGGWPADRRKPAPVVDFDRI